MSNITDLTGTTWYFNDTPSFDSSTHTYNINFTTSDALSGYTQFIYLKTSWIKSVYYGVTDVGDITAYGYFTDPNAQEWASRGCRTINITGGTDVTNPDLIEWLQANAIRVSTLVSSVQLPSGDVYQLKDAVSGYITADNIKPGENIIFTEDSEGNTVISSSGGGEPNTINHIQKNGVELPITNKTVNVTVPTKVSDLTNDTGFGTITEVTAGSGLTGGGTTGSISLGHSNSITAQTTSGLYPIKIDAQGHITEYGEALDLHEMVILRYGVSKWSDFIDAYRHNAIVYCRASSNSNPASGSQIRMAFMACVNNADNPANVEFQYYRSASSHTFDLQGDEVYIYKLESNNNWSVTVRKAYSKVDTEKGLAYTFTGGISSVVKLKANLQSETKLSNDSAAATEVSGRVYPVALDKSGYLAVNVPWTDSVNDVKVNGTSILSSGVADLITNTAYDSTNNKIATMSDITSMSVTDHTLYFSNSGS